MGVARLVRIGSPYNGSELAELDYEQSADVMYMAHIDHPPTRLNREAHDDWTFSTITFGPTIAAPAGISVAATVANTDAANGGDAYFPHVQFYQVTAVDDDTGQESRTDGFDDDINDLTLKRNYNTIAWSSVTGANRYRIYKQDNYNAFGYIGQSTGTTFIDDNITPDLSDGPPEARNPFDGPGSYPSAVTFHEQRLMWGRTKNLPNAFWGSRSGDYENMDVSRPQQDDDALSAALVAGKVNSVNQLVSTQTLLALASDNIFKITGGSDSDFLSPLSIVSRRQIGRGASRLNPLVIDNVVFYQPSVGSNVRSLGYSFELDGVKSDDVTIFSPHFFDGHTIVSWAYAQEPRSVIWAARDDGKLLCFTWEQEQQVWGWTLCETDGLVESVCTISEGDEDRLYLIVRRTIEAVERVYIERMAAARWEDVSQSCFADSAVTQVFEEPETGINGLAHLEGKAVTVLADGFVEEGHVVEGGSITLSVASTTVTVGLPFTAMIKTLPLAFQAREGWNTGKRQQAAQAVIRLVDSRGVLVGVDEGNLFEIKSRLGEGYNETPDLLNGLFEIATAPVTVEETTAIVQSSYPLPLSVSAVYLDPVVTD